jgi:lipid-binding SYLF domain-containing protein
MELSTGCRSLHIINRKEGETMKAGKSERSRLGFGKVAFFIAASMLVGLAAESAWAKTAQEINDSVNACLGRFYKQVPGGKDLAYKAKGVLVMPGVVKAGLIVGGEYGEGALRVQKRTVSYYNLASGSFGLQIGGEAKDIVILFMTDEALKQFQASKGWEVGVDANVALVKIGGGERVDLTKMNEPIIGFVFDVKGFMADISLKGAKFTRINPK